MCVSASGECEYECVNTSVCLCVCVYACVTWMCQLFCWPHHQLLLVHHQQLLVHHQLLLVQTVPDGNIVGEGGVLLEELPPWVLDSH